MLWHFFTGLPSKSRQTSREQTSRDKWFTIIVIDIHRELNDLLLGKSRKLQYRFLYKYHDTINDVNSTWLYETPWTTLGKFVRPQYQYDVHMELNSHDAHRIISIHTGRKPRCELIEFFLTKVLVDLILNFICY